MDRKRLNDYIYLKREIAKNKKRLEKRNCESRVTLWATASTSTAVAEQYH